MNNIVILLLVSTLYVPNSRTLGNVVFFTTNDNFIRVIEEYNGQRTCRIHFLISDVVLDTHTDKLEALIVRLDPVLELIESNIPVQLLIERHGAYTRLRFIRYERPEWTLLILTLAGHPESHTCSQQ